MNNDPNTNQSESPQTWSPVAQAMRHDLEGGLGVTKRGNPIDPADPGNPISRLVALVLCVVLVGLVVLWQNTGDELKFKYLLRQSAPVAELGPDKPAPGSFGQIDPVGRLFLRGYSIFKSQRIMNQIDPGGVGLYVNEDRVRLIMLAGEFESEEAALDRLRQLRSDIQAKAQDTKDPKEPDDLIIAELNALETIYTIGIDALEDNQRDQLAARYGLIGKVALTHGLDDTDPLREPLIDGSLSVMLFLLIAGLAILIVPLLGLVVLIIGIVFFLSGRLRMRNHVPMRGGSVFLETYVLFAGAFLAMFVAAFFFPALAPFGLLVQWLMLLTVFWGLIRGMQSGRWRRAIGWYSGEGVMKEIGCGVLVYIASVPLFLVGTLVTILLFFLQSVIQTKLNGGVPPDPEVISNEIFETIAQGDLLIIILFFVLAITWAPIVEEAIFRGALFRHLRSSMHWVFAALISAMLFAFMHGYGPLMVTPLIALGFMFAFMREWRGSLIAPMTAHFLHNFTLMTFMITLVQLIKDPV